MDVQKQTVFISHSSCNSEIVKQFMCLLQNIGILHDWIFCSSVLGQGVNNGEKLNDTIHTSLQSAKVIIYILSDAFLKSSYCLEELGVGWFLATDKKIKCYYLRLPDFEMNKLSGFVNSKIDKFSIINDFDDIILFMENICDDVSLPTQKVSIFSSYAKTFISAISYECKKLIEEKKQKLASQEQYKKEIDNVNAKLKEVQNINESYKKSIEINKVESNRHELMIELNTIVNNFRVLGIGIVASRDVILSTKQLCSNIAKRYEELLTLLELEPDDGDMEKLMSQFYLTCENYEQAYRHFLNAINILKYMATFEIEFFVEQYPFSLNEIIQICTKKFNNMPEGIEKDMAKDSLGYMKSVEKKKKTEYSLN